MGCEAPQLLIKQHSSCGTQKDLICYYMLSTTDRPAPETFWATYIPLCIPGQQAVLWQCRYVAGGMGNACGCSLNSGYISTQKAGPQHLTDGCRQVVYTPGYERRMRHAPKAQYTPDPHRCTSTALHVARYHVHCSKVVLSLCFSILQILESRLSTRATA